MSPAPQAWMNEQAEELKRRTFAFALAIVKFCLVLRNNWEGRELSDQLFRSGTRIGANYRAACRGRSTADFINKLGHVVEEADETVYWLDLIVTGAVSADPGLSRLRREAAELSAVFNQSQLTAKKNAARRKADASRIKAGGQTRTFVNS